MTGYSNLSLSYATQKTASGFATQTWEYSTDGNLWSNVGSVTSIPTSFGVQTFSGITGLNNAATAYLRVTFTGATNATGNNRIDNLVLVYLLPLLIIILMQGVTWMLKVHGIPMLAVPAERH